MAKHDHVFTSLPVLVSGDWRGVRESTKYVLGDLINLEVSMFTSQIELTVYVERCVATATPDMTSLPSYTLIDNGYDGQSCSRPYLINICLYTFLCLIQVLY